MNRQGRIARREELDRRIKRWKLNSKPPEKGWIRELRDALGMSARQLAKFLKRSQPAVTMLERAEVNGTIRLGTLKKAAEAMGCKLHYLIAPQNGKTLADVMHQRALFVATMPTIMAVRKAGLHKKINYELLNAMIAKRATYVLPRELWNMDNVADYFRKESEPPPEPPRPERTPEEEAQDELINELFRQQKEKIKARRAQGLLDFDE